MFSRPVRFACLGAALSVIMALLAATKPAPPIAGAQAQDTAGVIAAYQRAIGAGNYDTAATLFGDEMVAREPFGTFVSREAWEVAFSAFAAGQSGLTITMEQPTVTMTTGVYRMTVTSEPIRESGAGRLVFIETVVVADGKILTLTAVPDMSDPGTADVVRRARGG